MNRRNVIYSVAWFEEADYPALLRIMEDDSLQPTWAEWLASANEGIAKVESDGDKVVKVVVDPEDLARWCRAHGRKIDSDARALYAASQVARDIGV